MSRPIGVALLGAVLLSAPGCFWFTTKHEGERLRQDVDKLDTRVEGTEDALGNKVGKLENVLKEATDLLARNSADLGAEVDSLSQEQAKLTGLVMEAKRYADQIRDELAERDKVLEDRIAVLEDRLAEVEKGASQKSPAELYSEGKAAYEASQWDKAISLFRGVAVQHADHSLADNAQFYRAEAHLRKKEYKAALGEFQKVFEKYPKSDLAPRALFRAGETAEKLKWCTDARAYYGLLRQKYPKSGLARKARAKDRQLKRAAKNKKRCQS